MTAPEHIAHPATIPGRPRAYWALSHLVVLAGELSLLAALALLTAGAFQDVPDLPVVTLFVLWGIVATAVILRRVLRWQADAQVPGAWYGFSTRAEARAASPSSAPDQVATLARASVVAVVAVVIAAASVQPLVLGAAGLLAAVWFGLNLGVWARHRTITPLVLGTLVLRAVPAAVWSLTTGQFGIMPAIFCIVSALIGVVAQPAPPAVVWLDRSPR